MNSEGFRAAFVSRVRARYRAADWRLVEGSASIIYNAAVRGRPGLTEGDVDAYVAAFVQGAYVQDTGRQLAGERTP
ncbi:MAG TPA: hypothetical protein VJB16_05625 [archaeon]|nr:hypothetical protein [archaeon]